MSAGNLIHDININKQTHVNVLYKKPFIRKLLNKQNAYSWKCII